MSALLRPHFPHRENDDGSFDSICSACFVTVASAEKEYELAPKESMHKCEPINLYQASQGRPASGLSAEKNG